MIPWARWSKNADMADQLLLQRANDYHKRKEYAEAEKLYTQCLCLMPSHADVHHHLGALTYQVHGDSKFAEAVALVRRAIALAPPCAKYRRTLGLLQEKHGLLEAAAEALELANEKDPMNVSTLLDLARVWRALGRPARAAELYRSATLLSPDHPCAHYRRAGLLRTMGRREEARAAFRQHLRLNPGHAQSLFWIAALGGPEDSSDSSVAVPPPAAPRDMVAGLFDSYADRFDEHLVKALAYRTPQMIMDLLNAMCPQDSTDPSASTMALSPGTSGGQRWRHAADLGCGTGLMGELLRPHIRLRLAGADLSAGMLKRAHERGCYDELHCAELVEYLTASACQSSSSGKASAGGGASGSGLFDLLVAADVLVYVGDLQPFLTAAHAATANGALLAFSTEAMQPCSGPAAVGVNWADQRGNDAPLAKGIGDIAASTAPADSSVRSAQSNGRGEGHRKDHDQGSARQQQQQQDAGMCHAGYVLQPTGRYAHSEGYLHCCALHTGWEIKKCEEGVLRLNAGKPVMGFLCVFHRVDSHGSGPNCAFNCTF